VHTRELSRKRKRGGKDSERTVRGISGRIAGKEKIACSEGKKRRGRAEQKKKEPFIGFVRKRGAPAGCTRKKKVENANNSKKEGGVKFGERRERNQPIR